MKKIKKTVKNKISKNNSVDYLILLVFILSIIVPIIIASTQYYIIQYADDIVFISWAQHHHSNILDIFTRIGPGYRPMVNMWHFMGYILWGNEPFYYYLLNGALFSGSMIFLYLLGKILHSRFARLVAVLLYLFLDASFILVSKINFISTIGELFLKKVPMMGILTPQLG